MTQVSEIEDTTTRRTPAPAKITFAGENTYKYDIRE